MKNKVKTENASLKFFFCPASDYLNQHNETGSHGLLSYQFLRHLAMKSSVESIFAAVMMSLVVDPISRTKIYQVIRKSGHRPSLNDFDSLYFYLVSFLRFFRSSEYKEANFVHHIIPFKLGRSFNLFFLWKNENKKYMIGPIFGPHVSDKISADEEYVFIERKSLWIRISEKLFKIVKNIFLGLFSSFLYKLSYKTFQNADVLFFSDNYSMNFHAKFIKPSQKVIVMDTGVDLTVFKPANKVILKKKNDLVRVLFVGRLTKRKGCEYLIRALYEAKEKKENIKIHCDILGYGPLKEDMEKLVEKLSLTNDITFFEGVKNEELVSYYYSTDIICIPALSDTCTVIKEGMSSGKPIIVTDVCSHPEKVKSGVNGFIVPPRDSKTIANVLIKLTDDPSIINRLSQNALKMRSSYDWNNIIDKYIETIR